MSYVPVGRRAFGPPARAWIFPGIYVALALVFLGLVLIAEASPSSSWLFQYVVAGDVHRIVSARVLAIIAVLGGVAALVRTGMRGVVMHPDGVEARYVETLGWPRVRSCTWMEVDHVVIDDHDVSLHLWNGSTILLPRVADRNGLINGFERVASSKTITIRRGSLSAEASTRITPNT